MSDPEVSVPASFKAIEGPNIFADLSYRKSDPFVVTVVFHPGTPESVEWIIGRDLLKKGLDPVGPVDPEPEVVGDVKIKTRKGKGTTIGMSTPKGKILLHADTAFLTDFLNKTAVHVPFGEEMDYVDMGREIVNVFRRAGKKYHPRRSPDGE